MSPSWQLMNELRFAKNIEMDENGRLIRFTSMSYGTNSSLKILKEGSFMIGEDLLVSSEACGGLGAAEFDYDGTPLFCITSLEMGQDRRKVP